MVILLEKKTTRMCAMCKQQAPNVQYLWIGSAANLTGYNLMVICKKCARREIGSKSLKKWELLNDNPIALPEELGIR